MSPELLRPSWRAPPGVGAAMSLRAGGVSVGPWTSFNLGLAVGDDPAAVAVNRSRWAQALAARPVWLRQVHGSAVLHLDASNSDAPDTAADAAWTRGRGIACTVQVADCLPVLYALRDGSAVAAAHAGCRGLACGVLEATVRALCAGTCAVPGEVQVWLGPCIGPRRFEVGADVLRAFGQTAAEAQIDRFVFHPRADGTPRWMANLQRLARDRLEAAGVPPTAISAAQACTVEDPSAFFSFRRDGVTGRHAAAIWRG